MIPDLASRRHVTDERGFSMAELLIGVGLTLIILATTLGALSDGIRAGDTAK